MVTRGRTGGGQREFGHRAQAVTKEDQALGFCCTVEQLQPTIEYISHSRMVC